MDFQKYLDLSTRGLDNYNLDVVLDILHIKNNYHSIRNKCIRIQNIIQKNYPKLFELIQFLESHSTTKINVCKHLIVILYNMFNQPDTFKYPVSKKTYQKYIIKKKNGTITEKQLKVLEKMLYTKFCRCIKKIYVKNLKKHIFDYTIPSDNPYAFCTSSIYKNRGFDPPPSAARSCRDTFSWYSTYK